MRRASLCEKGRGDEQDLCTFEKQLTVELGESDVVGNAQAQVADRAEARLQYSVASNEDVRLSLVNSACTSQVDIKHVHFSVLSSDVAFLVDYRVGEVVVIGMFIALWEAPKRQPDLVI